MSTAQNIAPVDEGLTNRAPYDIMFRIYDITFFMTYPQGDKKPRMRYYADLIFRLADEPMYEEKKRFKAEHGSFG